MIPLDRDLLYEVEKLDELKLVNDRPNNVRDIEADREDQTSPPPSFYSLLERKQLRANGGRGEGGEFRAIKLRFTK